MKNNKLVVISMDALVGEDLKYLRQKPTFKEFLKHSSSVKKVTSVYPTLTYPCHVVQMTGQNIKNTGIYNNEIFDVSRVKPEWTWYYNMVNTKSIFDVAKENGLTTAAFAWPVTAGAKSIDYLMPEVWNMDNADDPKPLFQKYASKAIFEKYFDKHLEHLNWSTQPLFDTFVMSMAPDVIKNEQPDITFIHVSAVDIARHSSGLFSTEVESALDLMDQYLSVIFQAVKEAGNWENTNFVVMSDHGHLTVQRQLTLNVEFVKRGFITLDEKGRVKDYDAYVAGAGLSAHVVVHNKEKYGEVKRVLNEFLNTPEYFLSNVYTKHEAEYMYDLSGEFDFVIESNAGTAFTNEVLGRVLRYPMDEDFTYAKTGHGHQPELGIQPVFICKGPDFKENVVLSNAKLIDEVPTFAKILNLDMGELPGSILHELLKEERN